MLLVSGASLRHGAEEVVKFLEEAAAPLLAQLFELCLD